MTYALFLTESDIDLKLHLVLARRLSDVIMPVFVVKTPEYVDAVLSAGYPAFTYREIYERYPSSASCDHASIPESDLVYETHYLRRFGVLQYRDRFAQWMHDPRVPFHDVQEALRHIQRQACILETGMAALYEDLSPAFVSIWNGLFLPTSAFSRHLKRKGIPVSYCEEGCFPQTMTIDTQGVNHASGIAARKSFAALDDRSGRTVASFLETYHRGRSSRGAVEAQNRSVQTLPRKVKIILYPAQIDSDTNIVLASPVYATNDEAIRDILPALEGRPDLHLVVKVHPRDPDAYEQLKRYASDQVTVTDSGNIHDWIVASSVIVTRNSTVGLEALTYRKRVIALARSIYSGHGFTINALSAEDLKHAVRSATAHPYLSEEQWMRFRSFLYELLSRSTIGADRDPLEQENVTLGTIRTTLLPDQERQSLQWIDERLAESSRVRRMIDDSMLFLDRLMKKRVGLTYIIVGNDDDKLVRGIFAWLEQRYQERIETVLSYPSTSPFWRVRCLATIIKKAVLHKECLLVLVPKHLVRRDIDARSRVLAFFARGQLLLIDSERKVIRVP